MKRIIEIKRGDAVPMNAKRLKDISKVIKEWEETDSHPMAYPETKQEFAIFDVFEVEDGLCVPW